MYVPVTFGLISKTEEDLTDQMNKMEIIKTTLKSSSKTHANVQSEVLYFLFPKLTENEKIDRV